MEMPADRPETGPRARTLAQARAVSISTAVAALPHAVRRCSCVVAAATPCAHARRFALRAPRVSRPNRVAVPGRPRRRTFPTRRVAWPPSRARVYIAPSPHARGTPCTPTRPRCQYPGRFKPRRAPHHWNARMILSTHINVSTQAWPMGIRRRSVPSAQQDAGRFLLGARIPRRTHAPARGRRVRRSARIRTRTHPGDPTCAPWAYDAGAPPSPPGRPYLEGVGPCIRACRAGQPRATGLAAHPEKASAQGAHT